MKRILICMPLLAMAVSCTTLNESLKLGAATGVLTGTTAMYASQAAAGHQIRGEDIGVGASIGLGIGLITSYFIHQQVIEEREESSRQTEIYFGDLPPSPFVIPQPRTHKGGH